MASLFVVYDTVIQKFLSNRIFDRDYASQFPGGLSVVCLRDLVVQHGWQMITADLFLEKKPIFDQAVCVSERFTSRTEHLIELGVIPAVITSGESPNVDWRFYSKLSKHIGNFKHAFLFRGMKELVKQPTQFHPFYWPNARRDVIQGPKWDDRGFLVMVASNKQKFSVSNRAFSRMRRLAKRFIWSYLQAANPLFRIEDLYKKRLEAIYYFSRQPGFHLFGTGWEQPSGLSKQYFLAAQQAGAKPVKDKLKTMSNFKFALCFENCIFPGYVTEKIFDCFFAGCVPIYYGAPDITDFVPPETFIDFRNFREMASLDEYLRGLSETNASHYLISARHYLTEHEFDNFHQDTFAKQLMDILLLEFKSADYHL
jgi:hypothetical protein